MKFTPQSMPFRGGEDSASSTLPQALPMAQAPKLISETFQPSGQRSIVHNF